MKNPNFLTWLVQQADRPGPVGDLARAVKVAPERWPKARKQDTGWLSHMIDMKASQPEFAAYGDARMEYSQVYAPGPSGLPSVFFGGAGDGMVSVLEANGVPISYDEIGRETWDYSAEARPRVEAALRAWWLAGEVWAGYSEESRQVILSRWDKEALDAEKIAVRAKAEAAAADWKAQKERQRAAKGGRV